MLLAATNRSEILDPALLRAGRFDRQVLVDRPDRVGRVQILAVHVKRVKLEPDVDLEPVARLTPGFSGADLANLVNDTLGQMTYEQQPAQFMPGVAPLCQAREYSEDTAREIDCAVRRLIERAFERATGILRERRDRLEAGARQLLERETLTEPEIRALLSPEA